MWFELGPIERIIVWNFKIALLIITLVISLIFILDGKYALGCLTFLLFAINYHYFLKPKKELWYHQGKPEEFLNNQSFKAILNALNKAEFLKTLDFDLLFLRQTLDQKNIQKMIARLGIENQKFVNFLNQFEIKIFNEELKNSFKKLLQENVNSFLLNSLQRAINLKLNSLEIEVLFLEALTRRPDILKELQFKFQVELNDFLSAFLMENFKNRISSNFRYQKTKKLIKKPKKIFLNRAWTSRPTPFLDSLSEDLTFLAETGNIGFLIGHQKEIELLLAVLEKEVNNNAILIGEIGSGKTTILYHLAWLIKSDRVPKNIFDKRLILLNINLLYEKESEIPTKINKIVTEINKAKNIILALPDDKRLPSIIEMFKDLVFSQTPIIILATPENYTFLSKIPYIIDSFTPIKVNPLNHTEAVHLLSLEAILWEKQFNIQLTTKAIISAVKLADRFLKPKILPNSARELLLETINRAKIKKLKFIDENFVAETLSQLINIPIELPKINERAILLNLENIIHQELINQDEAVRQIAESLRTYRAGLAKSKGPIGVFLFIGPTGVGKTELAKILAKIYFQNQMIRLDMGQFQTQEAVEKLIGSENSPGILTESVKQKPYTVLLLDEFEKCHPKLWNIFLAIFDEGKIQDFYGREIDFSNTIIIATSNAHSSLIYQYLKEGKNYQTIKEEIKNKLIEIFPPELLNRFDEIIVFKPLSKEEVGQIVDLKIKELNNKLNKLGFKIELDQKAKNQIINKGYDEVFGARALERTIHEEIYDRISYKILKGELTPGKTIYLSFDQDWIFEEK